MGAQAGSEARRASQLWLKVAVATSGAALAAWSLLHMLGTLGVFAGADVMNGYARLLRQLPAALLAMRVVLLGLLAGHVVLTVRLVRQARVARPVRYARRRRAASSWASRSMKLTGPLLGLWLVYHVLSMYGLLSRDYVPGDVFHNLVVHLSSWLINGSYVLAAVLFGAHLWHGLVSVLQTVGASERIQRALRPLGLSLAIALTLGFLAPSFGVILGLLSSRP